MNEIQAVKTAKIEEVKKNSKKGFTLVELVVVIAILAILAAIAIPVVSSTITSSQRSSAKSNAQTIEVAIKEADAAISAKDDTVFVNKAGAAQGEQFKASSGSLTLKNIADAGHDNEKYKADNSVYEKLPPCCHYEREPSFLKKTISEQPIKKENQCEMKSMEMISNARHVDTVRLDNTCNFMSWEVQSNPYFTHFGSKMLQEWNITDHYQPYVQKKKE